MASWEEGRGGGGEESEQSRAEWSAELGFGNGIGGWIGLDGAEQNPPSFNLDRVHCESVAFQTDGRTGAGRGRPARSGREGVCPTAIVAKGTNVTSHRHTTPTTRTDSTAPSCQSESGESRLTPPGPAPWSPPSATFSVEKFVLRTK